MAYPNTLIFVDLASDDPEAAGAFYAEVFGWVNEGRPAGVFHRLDPGDKFLNPDQSKSEIGNLHLGIHNAANARPHPNPDGVEPRGLSEGGRKARIWILVSDDDSPPSGYCLPPSGSAQKFSGATTTGPNSTARTSAFRDPWGNEIVLWIKAGDPPQIPENFTRE